MTRRNPYITLFLFIVFSAPVEAQEAKVLRPDLIVVPKYLKDTAIDKQKIQGRTLLRLSTGVANIGLGPLEIFGGKVVGNQQEVWQRIYRSDGTSYKMPVGYFVYHPTHRHIHFEDFAIFRLRTVQADNSPGPVVAEGAKTSFCLRDTDVYSTTLPNYSGKHFTTCDVHTQGVSVGLIDVYRKSLDDQWIDVTNVRSGTYWLETEVDPDKRLYETHKSNNVSREKVRL
jgi:hypothetical protein